MSIPCRIAISILIALLITINCFSQISINKKTVVTFHPGEYTIAQTLELIERLNGVTISYNTSDLHTDKTFTFRNSQYTFEDILEYIFIDYSYEILSIAGDRILLRIGLPANISISGYIYDMDTGDRLGGAIVEDQVSKNVVFTNEVGFFSISIRPGKIHLIVKYLGYDSIEFENREFTSGKVHIGLRNNNKLTPIVITSDHSDNSLIKTSGQRIQQSSIHSFGSVVGVDDVINRIKYLPGVQSGNEGVGGLFVRGGSNDQNLILYDGIPLYEISHTAGISSIFINESINNLEVFKSSFPAKYSGRLSSIIDINLKEGDQQKNNATVTIGNYGPTINANGPIIKSKLTYNVSARTSWLHWYINPLLNKVIDYDDVDIKFTDINAKIGWHISPSHKLTYTTYFGTDKLRLFSETKTRENSVSFSLKEDNILKWGTYLSSFNYDGILSDKMQLSINAGYIKYDYQNRGAFSFRKLSADDTFLDVIDVVSISSIEDFRAGFNLDYFISNTNLFRIGFNYTKHKFNPTLRQSTIVLSGDDIDQISDNSSFIRANEMNAYVQQKIKMTSKIDADIGINFSASSARDKTYTLLEPRATFNIELANSFYTQMSFSRIHQFAHLLVNPGLGLPSNLWVPSTDNIKPESSDQVNFSIIKKFGSSLKLSLDAYYKWKEGLVEYLLSDGIYSNILNDNNFVPIFNEDKDWEENIESGSGRVKGLELFGEGRWKIFNYWMSYSLSSSYRKFPNINNGEPFPFKFDRRHDINLGFYAQLTNKKSFGLNWVYGSGTAFTLALESFPGVDGIELLYPGSRNNYRLPAFHHLDVFYEYENHESVNPYSIKIGVYNIYNQLNPYYVILYNDAALQKPILKQISIFPIFPYVTFKTSL